MCFCLGVGITAHGVRAAASSLRHTLGGNGSTGQLGTLEWRWAERFLGGPPPRGLQRLAVFV